MTELEDLDKELQEFEKSESDPEKTTKKTKSLTVTQTIEKFNELKNQSIMDSEDPELDKLEKETKKKLYKIGKLKEIDKMNEQIKRLESGDKDDSSQPVVLTPNEKVYVNFPVDFLEKFVEKDVFFELPSYVQQLIVDKIEKDKEEKRLEEQEKQRLIREEQIEQKRKLEEKRLAEEQARIAKEDQINKDYYNCPYCHQKTINKKVFNKNKEAICQNRECGKKVEKEMTLDELEHMLDVEIKLLDKFKQLELDSQQKQQEERRKQLQQSKEIIPKEPRKPIQYGPPKSIDPIDTILDTKFFQAAGSNVPDTIEALRKAIGEQGTERLVNALVKKVK